MELTCLLAKLIAHAAFASTCSSSEREWGGSFAQQAWFLGGLRVGRGVTWWQGPCASLAGGGERYASRRAAIDGRGRRGITALVERG